MDVKGIEFAYPSKYWWSTIPLINTSNLLLCITKQEQTKKKNPKAQTPLLI
jgi:hypothetical protein